MENIFNGNANIQKLEAREKVSSGKGRTGVGFPSKHLDKKKKLNE